MKVVALQGASHLALQAAEGDDDPHVRARNF